MMWMLLHMQTLMDKYGEFPAQAAWVAFIVAAGLIMNIVL